MSECFWDWRRFVPHYTEMAALLTNLTGKAFPDKFYWEGKHESCDQLKQALQENTVVAGPDYQKQFLLRTDASEIGIGEC